MKIGIRLFSRLREVAGTGELALELGSGATVGDVIKAVVQQQAALAPHAGAMLAAINEEWVGRDAVLAEGDELALMPPVSGG
jgi:molybdopterin synthase catalytic subunit